MSQQMFLSSFLVSTIVLTVAQTVPERALPPAPIELAEGFTRVGTIRELVDGRVLVVDVGDAVVRLADFSRGTLGWVGRQGGGPGEYRRPGRLLPLPGDSTLLTDPSQARSIVIGPAGVAGGALLSGSALAGAPREARVPAGVDTRRRLYYLGLAFDFDREQPVLDSVPLVRFAPESGQLDTLTRIKVPWQELKVERQAGKLSRVSLRRVPYMAQDDWTVLPDGRVLVMRTGDYHLDLIDADGRISIGPPIPQSLVAVSPGERKRVSWAQLPEFKPPFEGSAMLAAPDSLIWIRRTTAEDDSTARYDVVDLSGRLRTKVSLPARNHLVGFGKGSAYVVRKGPDDIEYLGRVPLPRF